MERVAREQMRFICNLCGGPNERSAKELDREEPSCRTCGSNVRTRGLLQALSMELFGTNLTLPQFPRVKSLRGIGTSDSNHYADRLAEKFDYRNTFHDREPRMDIANPPGDEFGKYDFLVSSEVFEHVVPPAEAAFLNAYRLLRDGGVLLLTVPYSLELTTVEHFPDLHEFGLAQAGGRVLLVNRTRDGEMQVFDNLVFHRGRGEPSLEMREFSESDLKKMLTGAGFSDVRIYTGDYAPFGIVRSGQWSLPIAARKGPFALSLSSTRDVLEEWRGTQERIALSRWCRLGRRLGLMR